MSLVFRIVHKALEIIYKFLASIYKSVNRLTLSCGKTVKAMNLKELREKANLRTMDVAVALNVAESSVRNWEHGRSVPSLKLGKPLARLYKCTLEQLCDAITANEGEKEKSVFRY